MKSLSHRLSLDKVRDKIRSLSSRHFCVMEKQKPASGRELTNIYCGVMLRKKNREIAREVGSYV